MKYRQLLRKVMESEGFKQYDQECVITSYSIHYTKLYEMAMMPAAMPPTVASRTSPRLRADQPMSHSSMVRILRGGVGPPGRHCRAAAASASGRNNFV